MTPDEYREAHGMDDDTEEDAVSEWTHDALAAVGADGLVNSDAGCACQFGDLATCGCDDISDCVPGRLNDCETCDPDMTPWDGCPGPGDCKEDWCMSPFMTKERAL
jgi:hypothetical protein